MSKKSRRISASPTPLHPSTLTPGEPLPEGAGHRHARLEHILIDELQSLIRDEATDPSLDGVVLLSVHLSPDAGHARVGYAVRAPLHLEREVGNASKAGLARASGFLRSQLAGRLELKKLPKLSFTFVGVTADDALGEGKEGGEPWPE